MSQDSTTNYGQTPLIIISVPGKKVVNKPGLDLKYVAANQIESLTVLKGDSVVKKYGPAALNGVISIILRKGSKYKISRMTNLQALLKKYQIKRSADKLALYVDSILINHKKYQFFDLTQIKTVKIETEATSGIKFINVLTNNPPEKNDGLIHIR